MTETERERTHRLRVLGAYLRRVRSHTDLSLRQLSELTGISKSMLNAIEHGRTEPSDEVIETLAANVMDCSADYLYYLCRRLPPDVYVPDVKARDVARAYREFFNVVRTGRPRIDDYLTGRQ